MKAPSPKLDQLRRMREDRATRFAAAEKATIADLRQKVDAVKARRWKVKKSKRRIG